MDEWQPIDSAPSGLVLCWHPMWERPEFLSYEFHYGVNLAVWCYPNEEIPEPQPTYWLPVPAFPVRTGAEP